MLRDFLGKKNDEEMYKAAAYLAADAHYPRLGQCAVSSGKAHIENMNVLPVVGKNVCTVEIIRFKGDYE